jgi:branched-subunit amino acid ABC-type transport system permease component
MDIPLDQILIQTINGVVTGMILALVASGLTLIFGIMDVVNFAHGDLVMLGGFTGATTLALTGNFWVALLAAAIVVAVIGMALQATALRPLIGRDPLTTILATFGISLVLQKYALWQWGPSARNLPEPITGRFDLFYLQYPWYRVATAILAGAMIGALWLFLKRGTYGIWIRATTQDRVMASAMGIPVPWVHTAVFAIGATALTTACATRPKVGQSLSKAEPPFFATTLLTGQPKFRSMKSGRTQSITCFAASAMCSALPPKSWTPIGRSHSSKSRYSRVRSFRRKTPSAETNSVTSTSAPRSLQNWRKILSDTPAMGAR